MQVTVIAVGHRMPGWIENGFAEYARRMPPEWHFNIKELKPVERAGNRSAETVMASEATKIRAAIPKNARLIALDERGKDLTTVQMAAHMKNWLQDGRDIVFVIGFFSSPRMLDRLRHFVPAEVIISIARQKAHTYQGG